MVKKPIQEFILNTKDILLTQNKVEMKGQRKEKQMEQLEIKQENGEPKSSYI